MISEEEARQRARRALPSRPWEIRAGALRALFEEISPHYDRLNRWLSLGLDRGWRVWAGRALAATPPGPWCDLASGTGELARILCRERGRLVLRADLSAALLRVGAEKLSRAGAREPSDGSGREQPPAGVNARSIAGGQESARAGESGIPFHNRSGEGVCRTSPGIVCEMDRLPFRDRSLAGITQGFALRHCREYQGFFRELHRALKPHGAVSLLDMRYPASGAGSRIYRFYFRWALPRLASLLGGERAAYEMMVESVRGLPPEENLTQKLLQAGFEKVESRRGFLGSVALLTARRPASPADPRG